MNQKYSKSKGFFKFLKVTALGLVAFGAALHSQGMLSPQIMTILIAGSAFAGVLYAADNYRKHRK